MNRIILLLVFLLVSGGWTAHAQQQNFYEDIPVLNVVPLRYSDAVFGDFDRDGDLDLVTTGYAEEDPTPIVGRDAGPLSGYYRNEGIIDVIIGDPSEEPVPVPALNMVDVKRNHGLIGLWQSAVATDDYDQDGWLDLGMLGLDKDGDPRFYIYRYQAGETANFVRRYSLDGLYAGDLAWVDLENDGDVDLIACGRNDRGEPVTVQYQNRGEPGGRFQMQASMMVGVAECDLDVGDFDTDGDLDLVLAGMTEQDGFVTLIYENNGLGQLTRTDHDFFPRGWPSVAWGDFDSDGDLDLAQMGARLAPTFLEGVITIYRNHSGIFSPEDLLEGAFSNDPTPGRYDGGIDWGDINGSGYLDFVITGRESPRSSETTQIYLSNRGTGFVQPIDLSSRTPEWGYYDGGASGVVQFQDYDADQDLDLFYMGDALQEGRPQARMMRNMRDQNNRAPSAPTQLSSTVQGQSVELSWNRGSDPETPEAGLTYNLHVTTLEGQRLIVSPLASIDDGIRRISRRGNVDHNTTWTLHDLTPGTYTWRVQTLDPSFTASDFSSQGTFSIPRN